MLRCGLALVHLMRSVLSDRVSFHKNIPFRKIKKKSAIFHWKWRSSNYSSEILGIRNCLTIFVYILTCELCVYKSLVGIKCSNYLRNVSAERHEALNCCYCFNWNQNLNSIYLTILNKHFQRKKTRKGRRRKSKVTLCRLNYDREFNSITLKRNLIT